MVKKKTKLRKKVTKTLNSGDATGISESTCEDETSRLRQQISRMQEHSKRLISAYNKKLNVLLQENKQLTESLESRVAETEESQASYRILEAETEEMEKLRIKYSSISAELQHVQQNYDAAIALIDTLKARITELDAKVTDEDIDIKNTNQSAVDDHHSKNTFTLNEDPVSVQHEGGNGVLLQSDQSTETVECENEMTRCESSTTAAEHSDLIHESNVGQNYEIDELVLKNKELEELLMCERRNSEEQLSALRSFVEEQKMKSDLLQLELNDSNDNYMNVVTELKIITSQMTLVRKENDKLLQCKEILSNQVKEYENDVEELSNRYEDECARLHEENVRLIEICKDLENTVSDLRQTEYEHMHKYEEVVKHCEYLEDEIAREREDFDRQMDIYRMTTKEENKKNDYMISRLKERMIAEEKKYEHVVDEYCEQLALLRENYDILEHEKKDKCKELKLAVSEIANLKEELLIMKEKLVKTEAGTIGTQALVPTKRSEEKRLKKEETLTAKKSKESSTVETSESNERNSENKEGRKIASQDNSYSKPHQISEMRASSQIDKLKCSNAMNEVDAGKQPTSLGSKRSAESRSASSTVDGSHHTEKSKKKKRNYFWSEQYVSDDDTSCEDYSSTFLPLIGEKPLRNNIANEKSRQQETWLEEDTLAFPGNQETTSSRSQRERCYKVDAFDNRPESKNDVGHHEDAQSSFFTYDCDFGQMSPLMPLSEPYKSLEDNSFKRESDEVVSCYRFDEISRLPQEEPTTTYQLLQTAENESADHRKSLENSQISDEVKTGKKREETGIVGSEEYQMSQAVFDQQSIPEIKTCPIQFDVAVQRTDGSTHSNEDIGVLKAELEKSRVEQSTLHDQMSFLRSSLDQVSSEKDALLSEIAALNSELDEKTTRLRQITEPRIDTTSKIAELESKISSLLCDRNKIIEILLHSDVITFNGDQKLSYAGLPPSEYIAVPIEDESTSFSSMTTALPSLITALSRRISSFRRRPSGFLTMHFRYGIAAYAVVLHLMVFYLYFFTVCK